MLNRIFGPKTHDNINLFAVFSLAIGLPLNKVVMSLATALLALNFLLNGDFKNVISRVKKSKTTWFIAIVFLLHFVGVFYSTDLNYALRDINIKMPLFVIPIVMIAYPIKQSQLKYILFGFIASLLLTSIVNINFMLNHPEANYREFSRFGSHIRYGLLIVMGILVILHFTLKNKKWWPLHVVIIIWLIYYTIMSQVFSGYVALCFLGLGCFIYFIMQVKNFKVRSLAILIFFGSLIFTGYKTYDFLTPDQSLLNFSDLPTHSQQGTPYYNDTTTLWFENGHHVPSLIAENELKKEWKKRSEIPFKGLTKDGKNIKPVILCYMSSKGLPKDKVGMDQLTPKDIENIENGITSIHLTYNPFKKRLTQLRNELYLYSIGFDPDGNSLLQRFEHWRAGSIIIQNNWLFGVGTGDLQISFNQVYSEMDSQLNPSYWRRAHNQFMTFWIAFGIFGFIIFTSFWCFYLCKNIALHNFIGIGFALISIGSFISEDTLETQQGATFVALFLGIVAIMNYKK